MIAILKKPYRLMTFEHVTEYLCAINRRPLTVAVLMGMLLTLSVAIQAATPPSAYWQAVSEGKAFMAANKNKPGIMTTASGLQYQILTPGIGQQKPRINSRVTVHYHGTRLNGDVFDSSVQRNNPISFSVNQVIKGWIEGLQLMTTGAKYRLFIPSELAYGNRPAGKIPAGSTLIFDVELISIDQY